MKLKAPLLLVILLTWALVLTAQTAVDIRDVDKAADDRGIETIKYAGKLYDGTVVAYGPKGSPSLSFEVKNGYPDGLWQEWYANGKLRFSAMWKEGRIHGFCQYYHENGQLRQDEYLDMDQPVGIQRDYHNNGQLKSSGGYLRGQKHGYFLEYDASGILLQSEEYREGVLVNDAD